MLRHACRAISMALTALLLLAASAAPVAATLPGRDGRIAFMRHDAEGQFQVWVANPDMTHQIQLTFGPSDAWFPSWSPDGTRIVFASHRTDPDPNDGVEIMDVFTMRADGSDLRQITDSVGYSGSPSWSPDGRWIVYAADRGDFARSEGIYLIRSDGSGKPRRVTSATVGSDGQELPRFSPDGRLIVFDEGRGGQLALFTVRPDGTRLRQLTPWELNASDADWSPDGRRLVFGARPPTGGGLQEVMIADADGSHVRNLSNDQSLAPGEPFVTYSESFNPAWSPDGRWVVFVHASYTPADGFVMGLQVIRPDGSRRSWLSLGDDHQPDWGSAPPLR